MSSELNMRAADILAKVRENRPLIHHMTNFVVMNDTANITLHVGALPVMAHAPEEVEEMASGANVLVLNPGTLSSEWVDSMKLAGAAANEAGVPVVLDPVGAGATRFRTTTNLDLLRILDIAAVRGNAGEIAALCGAGGEVRGVESVGEIGDTDALAVRMIEEHGTVVAMTGVRDTVAGKGVVYHVRNGHEWLTRITGTGCMSTTMVAAFIAVEEDRPLAAAAALAVYGLAAEIASENANGPASFRMALLDAVFCMTPEQVACGARINAKP